ncbi:hypothetical protein CS542_09075 [Pedobacter sp. IW39]|nr:hypothetical protein CS542_09075 [Pedobacter sp. IW39]
MITGRETNLLFVHNEELLDTTAVDMMMGHFKQVLLQLVEKEENLERSRTDDRSGAGAVAGYF